MKRVIVYIPGTSEVWLPVEWRGNTRLSAVSRALASSAFLDIEPGDDADEGAYGGEVRLLMLDRVLAFCLQEFGTGDDEWRFLFLLTHQEQEPSAAHRDRDTRHLRPLLEKWGRSRARCCPNLVVDFGRLLEHAIDLDYLFVEVAKILEERFVEGVEVVLVLGPGTPQINLSAFSGTFTGLLPQQDLRVWQAREQRDGENVVDTTVVALDLPQLVGGRQARRHVLDRLRHGELAEASSLVSALPVFSHREKELAAAIGAYLLRASVPHEDGAIASVRRPAGVAVDHCLDIVEALWERTGREGWSIMFHLSILVNELLASAWLEWRTGRACDFDSDRQVATDFVATMGYDTLRDAERGAFLQDIGSRRSPAKLALALCAPQVGRRQLAQEPKAAAPAIGQPPGTDEVDTERAIWWVAASDAIRAERNRYMHWFAATETAGIEPALISLSEAVTAAATTRFIERVAPPGGPSPVPEPTAPVVAAVSAIPERCFLPRCGEERPLRRFVGLIVPGIASSNRLLEWSRELSTLVSQPMQS